MKSAIAILGALAPSLITGCLDARTASAPESARTVTALNVHDGHVRGTIGDVHGLDDDATLTEGVTDGIGISYVKVQTDTPSGTGMVILNLDGIRLADLPVGETAFAADSNEPPLNALGCSGPTSTNIAYDQLADHGVVRVSERNDGARAVTVTGVWTRATNYVPLPEPAVATGSFVYTP